MMNGKDFRQWQTDTAGRSGTAKEGVRNPWRGELASLEGSATSS